MMPFMGDSLLPFQERESSLKYKRLSRWFDPYRMIGEENIEAQAMLMTPGLLRTHVFALLRWNAGMYPFLPLLAQLGEQAQALAQANAMGADVDDGRAMLVTILENFPDWSRVVPLWSTRYLQDRRRRGANAKGLAEEFRTTVPRVLRWWRQDVFDPLTGLRRPAGTVRRNRPIVARQWRFAI